MGDGNEEAAVVVAFFDLQGKKETGDGPTLLLAEFCGAPRDSGFSCASTPIEIENRMAVAIDEPV
jgi:hypothetical protein